MAKQFRTDALLVLAFFPSVISLLAHAHLGRHTPLVLPPPALANNIPYWLLARGVKRIIGPTVLALLATNTLLMLLLAWLLFEVGRNLSIPRPHPAAGATAGLLLFQLCPLVLTLPGVPLIHGWDGGRLLVPVTLLAMTGGMLSIAHWSTFMRSIALALVWSFLVWVHPPTAGIVLVAMIPWVVYNRRRLPALGTWLTVAIFGTILFLAVWVAGRLLSGHPIGYHELLHYAAGVWTTLEQGFLQPGWPDGRQLIARLHDLLIYASPPLVLLGFWLTWRSLRFMARERRASALDLVALLSLAFFAVLMLRPYENIAQDWRLLTLVGLWCLLTARELSGHGRLARHFFAVALLGLLFGAATSPVHAIGTIGFARPGFSMTAVIFGGLLAAGALSYALEVTRGMEISNRLQAVLVGSTLGFFVMSDGALVWFFMR